MGTFCREHVSRQPIKGRAPRLLSAPPASPSPQPLPGSQRGACGREAGGGGERRGQGGAPQTGAVGGPGDTPSSSWRASRPGAQPRTCGGQSLTWEHGTRGAGWGWGARRVGNPRADNPPPAGGHLCIPVGAFTPAPVCGPPPPAPLSAIAVSPDTPSASTPSADTELGLRFLPSPKCQSRGTRGRPCLRGAEGPADLQPRLGPGHPVSVTPAIGVGALPQDPDRTGARGPGREGRGLRTQALRPQGGQTAFGHGAACGPGVRGGSGRRVCVGACAHRRRRVLVTCRSPGGSAEARCTWGDVEARSALRLSGQPHPQTLPPPASHLGAGQALTPTLPGPRPPQWAPYSPVVLDGGDGGAHSGSTGRTRHPPRSPGLPCPQPLAGASPERHTEEIAQIASV